MSDFELKQAVILAGGRGERLMPFTNQIPKPMVDIAGRPFLDYLINSLQIVGLKDFLILLGYKGDVIKKRYTKMNQIDIEFFQGKVEDQTGRRVLDAYDLLDNHFLLVYGDNYWPLNLKKMLSNYLRSGTLVSTTVFSNIKGTSEYGFENNIKVGSDGLVIKYDNKRYSKDTNGVDIGYFIVSKESLDPNLTGNVSYELDLIPQLIEKKQLAAFITDTQYYYITNLKTLRQYKKAIFAKNFHPLSKNYFRSHN